MVYLSASHAVLVHSVACGMGGRQTADSMVSGLVYAFQEDVRQA